MTSYGELRGQLADDLGLDPGPALAALYQAILEQAPDLQRVPPPATLAARPRTNLPAQALTGLAGAHALGGRPDQAARLLGAADQA